jgi:electron transport complex protein RnfE
MHCAHVVCISTINPGRCFIKGHHASSRFSADLSAGASTSHGPAMGVLEMRVHPGDGALVMLLPAGGFIVLGLLIAAKRALDVRKPSPWSHSSSIEGPASVTAAS